MKIAFDITHPADVHQFRNCIARLINLGHSVRITARNSAGVIKLLQEFNFDYRLRRNSRGSFHRLVSIPPIVMELYLQMKSFKPDMIVGSSGNLYVPLAAKMLKIQSIIFDDTEHTLIQNLLTFPFADYICTPNCYKLDLGKRQILYNGSKELAYLHPNCFVQNGQELKSDLQNIIIDEQNDIVRDHLLNGKKIILIRLVAWSASHDLFKRPLFSWRYIIDRLKSKAIVIIVSDNDEKKNAIRSNVFLPLNRFHDLISIADIVISEGATTAAEAAVLGKPVIYCNKLRLGYIDEYDRKYGLIRQIYNEKDLLTATSELLADHNLDHIYKAKRECMLQNMIDVNEWMVGFLTNMEQEKCRKKIYITGNFDPQLLRPGGIENYVKSIIESMPEDEYRISTIGVTEITSNRNPEEENRNAMDKSYSADKFSPFSHLSVMKNKDASFSRSFDFLRNLFLKALFLKIDEDAVLHFQRPDHAVPFLLHKNPKLCSIHGNPAEVIRITRSRLEYYIYQILERISLPCFRKIGFIDQHSLKVYESKYPKHTDKFVLLFPYVNSNFRPYGIKTISKLRRKHNIKRNERVLLVVARLEKEKNLFQLLEIFNSLEFNSKSNRFRLLIAGTGTMLVDLKKLIVKYKNENVTLLGHVKHSDLPDYYNLADATFIYSHSEGLPLVALESLACGTPVLSNATGDLPRLIKNDFNGYIVDEQNVKERLNHLLKSRPNWRKNCVTSVRDYRAERFQNRLKDFYNINKTNTQRGKNG
ncbi:glycosyltransferase [candidate division KSB1 bacterium]|nr:glycosyltransferase [candidate division KSB1 bacterium]